MILCSQGDHNGSLLENFRVASQAGAQDKTMQLFQERQKCSFYARGWGKKLAFPNSVFAKPFSANFLMEEIPVGTKQRIDNQIWGVRLDNRSRRRIA